MHAGIDCMDRFQLLTTYGGEEQRSAVPKASDCCDGASPLCRAPDTRTWPPGGKVRLSPDMQGRHGIV